MEWLKNNLNIGIPTLFVIKTSRDYESNSLPDFKNEADIHDVTTDADECTPTNNLHSDLSNPRDALLKNPKNKYSSSEEYRRLTHFNNLHGIIHLLLGDHESNRFPDYKNEEDVYDETTDGDLSPPMINQVHNNKSSPRDEMLKDPNKNENCCFEKDADITHFNNPHILHPSSSNSLNPFHGGNEGSDDIFQTFGVFSGFNNTNFFRLADDISASMQSIWDSNSGDFFSENGEQSNFYEFKSPTTKYTFKSSSTSTRIIQPDGTIVEKKIYKDSSGAEEESVTTYTR